MHTSMNGIKNKNKNSTCCRAFLCYNSVILGSVNWLNFIARHYQI